MIHNTNNKNTLRKRLPAGAAVTLLGATVVAGILPKGGGAESPSNHRPAVETEVEATNPFFVDREAMIELTPEEIGQEYVRLEAGAYRGPDSNNGTLWGLARDYGSLYDLDNNQLEQVQEELLRQNHGDAGVRVGDEFYLPQLGEADVNENQFDQVK